MPSHQRLAGLLPWQPSQSHDPDWGGISPDAVDDGVPDEPARVLVIASSPRSGSTLLSRALGSTGLVGHPAEYFNPTIVANLRATWGMPRLTLHGVAGILRRRLGREPEWWQSYRYARRSMERYRRVVMASSSPSGWFSVKIHWPAYRAFSGSPWDPLTWEAPISWVHLTRRDLVRQAVSFTRARQTGAWTSEHAPAAKEHYDSAEIAANLARAREWDQGWTSFFLDHGIEPVSLVYEDLAGDFERQVRRVLDGIGLPEAPVPAPSLGRQSDAVTEEWVQRFLRRTGS